MTWIDVYHLGYRYLSLAKGENHATTWTIAEDPSLTISRNSWHALSQVPNTIRTHSCSHSKRPLYQTITITTINFTSLPLQPNPSLLHFSRMRFLALSLTLASTAPTAHEQPEQHLQQESRNVNDPRYVMGCDAGYCGCYKNCWSTKCIVDCRWGFCAKTWPRGTKYPPVCTGLGRWWRGDGGLRYGCIEKEGWRWCVEVVLIRINTNTYQCLLVWLLSCLSRGMNMTIERGFVIEGIRHFHLQDTRSSSNPCSAYQEIALSIRERF